MTESGFWGWLRDGRLPCGHYTRVESECSPGFPDVDYILKGPCGHEMSGNIELKIPRGKLVPFPYKEGEKKGKGMRPSQVRWITDAVEHGGTVWILAPLDNELYFIPGCNVKLINNAQRAIIDRIVMYRVPMKQPREKTRSAIWHILGKPQNAKLRLSR